MPVTVLFHVVEFSEHTTFSHAELVNTLTFDSDPGSLALDAIAAALAPFYIEHPTPKTVLTWTSDAHCDLAPVPSPDPDIDPEIEDANNNHGQPDLFDYEWSGAD